MLPMCIKKTTLVFMLVVSAMSFGVEHNPHEHYEFELALPIPFPICDPVRELDPDPTSWRVGIVKITAEMREHLMEQIEALGPDPQPWEESEFCTLVY